VIPSVEIECSNEECRQKMVVIPPTVGTPRAPTGEPAVIGLPEVGEGQRLVEAGIAERDPQHPDDPEVAVARCPTCGTPNEVPGLLEA